MLHEACFYRGMTGFVEAAKAFIEEDAAAGQAVLVAVSAAKIDALREVLGADRQVTFADMAQLGRNPGRIISTWRRFVGEQQAAGRACRGIGEPIWPGRTEAELVECQRHEVLLNSAFAAASPWRLLCTYDITALKPAVLDEAMRSHPTVTSDGVRAPSEDYLPDLDRLGPELPAPPPRSEELAFTKESLRAVRRLVLERARQAGLSGEAAEDLALAAHEIAVNSVRHGGGWGLLHVWRAEGSLICQVDDYGTIVDPLVGRAIPAPGARLGRGLWMVNELCDLVRLRSTDDGTVVRMQMNLPQRES
ncbi:sensor histidine kinase [Amycolatopsis nigrescens]|uniref:sensor histidine kinase n=1 Tax=Amycolatopsis nigrescens TaxID=381445 RepID=UPI000687196B|nr:sensor histidine kinase [Amycolatopsis nigrescens]